MELAAGSRTWYPSPASLQQVIFVPNFPAPAEPVVYPTEGEAGPSALKCRRWPSFGVVLLFILVTRFQSESNIITYTVSIYIYD